MPMTPFSAHDWAGYLAEKRAAASVTAAPTEDELLALVKDEHIKQHGSSVHYEYVGDDANGPAVYQLGTLFLTVDVSVQLAALVVAGKIAKIPGAKAAYSVLPSLRK